jgi:hypothetical protein
MRRRSSITWPATLTGQYRVSLHKGCWASALGWLRLVKDDVGADLDRVWQWGLITLLLASDRMECEILTAQRIAISGAARLDPVERRELYAEAIRTLAARVK